jgi:hypothetical protein
VGNFDASRLAGEVYVCKYYSELAMLGSARQDPPGSLATLLSRHDMKDGLMLLRI